MIHLESVTFGFGESRKKLVFEDLTASIPSDKRFVLLGGRGSGKTTLINLIAGRLAPRSGRIHRRAQVSYPIGYSGGFGNELSVRQNVAHVARLYEANPSEILDVVAHLTGLGHLLNHKIGELMVSDRSRISWALSYALPFDTYLVDGIVGVGDDAFRQKCNQLLEARASHAGIILATRNSKYVRRFGDRGAVLHNGRLEFYNDPKSLVRRFEELFPPTLLTSLNAIEEVE